MALLQSELERCKAELGFALIGTANPFIGTVMLFEQIIQPYLSAGAVTTSSTAVTAHDDATPKTITLASATGFAAGARVVVDVDGRQETATVRSLSGADITVDLKLAHTGTYPVTVEGGETIVREYLTRIREVKAEMAGTFGEGALKSVDEVSFYDTGISLFGSLGNQLKFWRDELASVLGIQSMWQQKRAGAQRLAVY
jgi:hypothetical protein